MRNKSPAFTSFHPDFPTWISLSEIYLYVFQHTKRSVTSNTFSLSVGYSAECFATGSASRLCGQGEYQCVRNKEGCLSAAAVLCLQIGFQEIWWMPNACSQLWRRRRGGGSVLVWIWIRVSGTGSGLEFCPWPPFWIIPHLATNSLSLLWESSN